MTQPIYLDSVKSRTAEETSDALKSLEARLPNIRKMALDGKLNASTLADLNDEIALAKMRAELAGQEATDELSNLGSDEEINAAIDELLADKALGVDSLAAAADAVRQSLVEFERANDARNAVVTQWVQKLRGLGVPNEGLSIGDDDVRIYSSHPSVSITVGGAQVESVPSTAPYVAHIAQKYVKGAHVHVDPATVSRADRRATGNANIVAVRLTVSLGNLNAGDIITSHDHPRGVLAQMVHAGNAELIGGQISDPSPHQRTYFGVSPLPQGSESSGVSVAGDEYAAIAAIAAALTD